MRRLYASLLALLASLAGAAPASAYTESELKTKIAREMAQAPGSSGAYVRDMDTGEQLYALRENAARIPASVEKLFTTASALLRLGPSATLQTDVVTAPDAVVEAGGVLRGDLVLVGGGDPFFGDGSGQSARLARAVYGAGIRRVAGSVVGDESAFDGRRSSCCSGYDFDLGGVLSALAYDRGVFEGRVRLNAGGFAAGRFATQLRAAGVTVTGKSRSGAAPAAAKTIASVLSMPVGELARYINVPSNNFAAEMLFKKLGARYRDSGTTAAGADVVRDTLDDFGVRPRIADGSGLSRVNRATPRQVVRLLERMRNQDIAASFRRSLAVTGATGTVKRRMRGTPAAGRCQVKTGTLRGVSALAGYCRAAGGRDIGFALMFNRANTFVAKSREDRIAAAIARLSSPPRTPPQEGGTLPRPPA
ncbi:MAG: D-alanyl-D-alanine carboxypeptidase [uncultured Solirubrobacteraceae bacterium]|uniref:D-alanyl-D-alanine carboxypeptidase n=1 Tax=uncultured Solirubrobacteraceae bacterium TaxID=1162706 RepID=A0A6J4SP40_9ACTN|nr:MAG: D-alanyl-D-alanine carboxypeptidase [uncultured Solirubrobacteraceae bacterium]